MVHVSDQPIIIVERPKVKGVVFTIYHYQYNEAINFTNYLQFY